MNGKEWESVKVDIKEFFERIINERDSRYTQMFTSQDRAVMAALTAQKEQTAAAFASSEKAIDKAEATGRENDAKNNEFRGQLTDQAATFPTRPEVTALIGALEGRLTGRLDALTGKLETVDASVRMLRESRSESEGRGKLAMPLIEKLITFALALVAGYVLAQFAK